MTDGQNQVEAVAERDINPLELLQVLVKRKRVVIRICGFAVLASVAYSLLLPNIYSASAKVLPPQKEGVSGLSALLGQAGGLAGLAAGSLGGGGGGDLYVGMLKSRSVEDAVIKRLNLIVIYKKKNLEEARRSLEAAVKVQSGKDGIITIVTENKDPKLSAAMANTFVEELAKTSVRLNLSRAGAERSFLEKRLEVVKKDLKAAEESLKSFAESNMVVHVDSQAKASIEGIARLKAELAKQEVQLAVASSNLTERSPEVQAINTGISKLKRELAGLAVSSAGGDAIPSVGNVPRVGLDYGRRLRDFKIQEAIFDQLTKQYELAKLNEAKDSSTLQVLDEALVPVRKTKPMRSLIVLVSTVIAFLISVFTVFVQEYLARMPEDDRQVLAKIKRDALALK